MIDTALLLKRTQNRLIRFDEQMVMDANLDDLGQKSDIAVVRC